MNIRISRKALTDAGLHVNDFTMLVDEEEVIIDVSVLGKSTYNHFQVLSEGANMYLDHCLTEEEAEEVTIKVNNIYEAEVIKMILFKAST